MTKVVTNTVTTTASVSVLFVCLGNICRSPSAQGIFESAVRQAGLGGKIHIDSCGTAAFNVGKNPDPRAILACEKRGYDISGQIARQVDDADYHSFDFLLGMDAMNVRNLKNWAPEKFPGEINLMQHYNHGQRHAEIPDPYYAGAEQFDHVINTLEHASEHLLHYIVEKHQL